MLFLIAYDIAEPKRPRRVARRMERQSVRCSNQSSCRPSFAMGPSVSVIRGAETHWVRAKMQERLEEVVADCVRWLRTRETAGDVVEADGEGFAE